MDYKYGAKLVVTFDEYKAALKEGYCVFMFSKQTKSYIFREADFNKLDDDESMYIYASLLRSFPDEVEDADRLYFSIMRNLAEKGFVLAYHDLGVALSLGTGTEKDFVQSHYWLNKAVDNGLLISKNSLAVSMYIGENCPKDVEAAIDIFKELADMGYRVAQRNYAIAINNGYREGGSLEKAFAWFLKSAEQGDASSQYTVANWYLNGKGVQESDTEARYWALRARDNGNKNAQRIIDYFIHRSQLEEAAEHWYEVDYDKFVC